MRLPSVLVLVVIAAACPRLSLVTSPTAERATGTACDSADQCISGICAQGMCCERACGGTSSCALDGHRGECMPRVAGSACTADAECPSDARFCDAEDRVCCRTECDGECHSCNLEGHVGECSVAVDNTDPLGKCTGDCRACVAGQCAPAFPGTDPNASCDEGKMCNGLGECSVAGGGACTVDGDCATGRCIVGICLEVDVDVVDSPAIPETDLERGIPQGMQPDALGGLILSARSVKLQVDPGDPTTVDDDAYFIAHLTQWAVTRQPAGWVAQVSEECVEAEDLTAVAKVGVMGLLFHAHQPSTIGLPFCVDDRPNEYALTVSFFSPEGLPLRTQQMHTYDPSEELRFLTAASSWDGQVAVLLETAPIGGPSTFLLFQRNDDGSWRTSPPLPVGPFAQSGRLVLLGGHPVLVGAFEGEPRLRAVWLDDPSPRSEGINIDRDCPVISSVRVASAEVDDKPVAYAMFGCFDDPDHLAPGFAVLSAGATPAWSTPRRLNLGDDDGGREVAVVALGDGSPALIYLGGGADQILNVVKPLQDGWSRTQLVTARTLTAQRIDSLQAVSVGSSVHIAVHAYTGRLAEGWLPYAGRTMLVTLHP